jgi:hypothetical protein
VSLKATRNKVARLERQVERMTPARGPGMFLSHTTAGIGRRANLTANNTTNNDTNKIARWV